jgi:hypothetical protein
VRDPLASDGTRPYIGTSVIDQHAWVRSRRQPGGIEHAVPHPIDLTVVADGRRYVGQKPSDRRHRAASEALLPIGRSAQAAHAALGDAIVMTYELLVIRRSALLDEPYRTVRFATPPLSRSPRGC